MNVLVGTHLDQHWIWSAFLVLGILKWSDILLWFQFVFSWIQMILSIFLGVYLVHVYLLWYSIWYIFCIFQNLFHFLLVRFWVFHFRNNLLIWYIIGNYFLLVFSLSLPSFNNIFYKADILTFLKVWQPLFFFLFVSSLFLWLNICVSLLTYGHKIFVTLSFSTNFIAWFLLFYHHCELNFACGAHKVRDSFFCFYFYFFPYKNIYFPALLAEKTILSSMKYHSSVENLLPHVWVYFRALYSIQLSYRLICLSQDDLGASYSTFFQLPSLCFTSAHILNVSSISFRLVYIPFITIFTCVWHLYSSEWNSNLSVKTFYQYHQNQYSLF